MICLSCRSDKQVELTAEMLVHFRGLKNLDKPGFWLFPELLVCLDCGLSRFSIPKSNLGSLALSADEIRATSRECGGAGPSDSLVS
jgi:hypothetical protein